MEDSAECSSDDDVCFGEYTIEEAKRDLKKYVYRPISRRHTAPYNIEEQKVQGANDETTSTEYFTAENTMKMCSQNSRGPSPSSFFTVPEHSEGSDPGTNNIDNESFYELAKIDHECYLSKITQTLVENTYDHEDLRDLNDSVITVSDDSRTHSCTSPYIYLSDEEADDKLFEAVAVNEQSALVGDDSQTCSHTSFYKSLHSNSHSSSDIERKIPEAIAINNQSARVSDDSQSTSCTVFKYYSDEVEGKSKTQEKYTDSYDACEHGFGFLNINEDKSTDKSSQCQELEDSLDDINRFLTQLDDRNSLDSSDNSVTPELIPSQNYKVSPALDVKRPIKPHNTYATKLKPPSVFSNVLTPDKPKVEFKVPTKLPKKLLTPKSLPNKPNLKDVVSPIRLYINNSPKYCPLIKVKPKESHVKVGSLGSTSAKENIPLPLMSDIPPVIYNPAKINMVQENKVIKLPGNMKKLINEPIIVRHEYRINMENRSRESVEQKLSDPNWTMNTDDTIENTDTSFLTSNQAFNV